jgi:hypothetical protein
MIISEQVCLDVKIGNNLFFIRLTDDTLRISFVPCINEVFRAGGNMLRSSRAYFD